MSDYSLPWWFGCILAAAPLARQDNLSTKATISIWPRTNAVMMQFELPDSLIPQIRDVVCTIRSTEWQQEFQKCEWGLNEEQSLTLTKAMLADLGTETPKVTNHSSHLLSLGLRLMSTLLDSGAIRNAQDLRLQDHSRLILLNHYRGHFRASLLLSFIQYVAQRSDPSTSIVQV